MAEGNIDMTASANRDATAESDRTALATTPKIKLSRRKISIDHPDPEAGERLLADALGAVDRDALQGLLKQLVKASTVGQNPDKANLAFMISMMKSIAPRDSVEAMLAAQIVAVHVMAMRCAYRLACADDIPRQDSAARAFGRLARIFPAQVEALNRYRGNGERAITVQNLSLQDGGKAIESHAIQHAKLALDENALKAETSLACETRAPRHDQAGMSEGATA